MMLEPGIKWGIENTRKLFLIDGLGAMLSAFLLGIVLVEFEPFFGIPRQALCFLALFPCLFALYDLYCYLSKSKKVAELLKGIALMNIAYCMLSVGVAAYHSATVTFFGWGYILLEILIVIALASVEWKVGANISSGSSEFRL